MMSGFVHGSPLFVLFMVAAGGFLLGKITVLRFSLGVSAVLFSGLFVGAVAPSAEIPEFVPQLGLVLFVYTLGLASGPGFFASLRLRGGKPNLLALGVLGLAGLVSALLARVLGLGGAHAAGLFAGALTNTPALASAVDLLKRSDAPATLLAAPVIAYSVCYPMGVLIPMIAVSLADRVFRVGYRTEKVSGVYGTLAGEAIINATVLVDRDPRLCAAELRLACHGSVVFGRMRRQLVTTVVHDDTVFAVGDLVTVIGAAPAVAAAARALGSVSANHIDLDRSEVDYRRMFVSNSKLTGRPLAELDLLEKYDAVITRVRRGDVDLVPGPGFELQPGDRARVLAPIGRMEEVRKLFGDSQRHAAEVDVITFSLGIALGLLLGAIPIPLAGKGFFQLGLAGGPLVAGLVLGRIGRSGPLVWLSPLGANLTLRQFGLVLFLAGVGVRAGRSLSGALGTTGLLSLFLAGALVTALTSTLALVVGHKLLRIPLNVMIGTVSGIHTQPAVLAFAVEKAQGDLPNVGYTTVFPIATVGKIVLAQIVLASLAP